MMHSKLALVAATTALASLIPSAIADGNNSDAKTGSANVQNSCGDDVYLWSIAGSADEKMITLKPGESYSEAYRTNANGGGLSLKISLTEDQKEVSQFEYTLSDSESKVYYDLSNIDGYPFKDGGITITPSDSSCPVISCDAGVAKCHEAYNQPYDDHATKGCSWETNLDLVLCAGQPEAKEDKAKKAPTYTRPADKSKRNGVRHPHAFNA